MSRPWMALYVGDYLADTAHLSAGEHGAYLLLIMHYWRTGGLPDDDAALSRIARMKPSEWRRSRPVINAFFQPNWKHKRIEIEIAEAAKISEAGRKAGKASAAAKRQSRSTIVQRSLENRSNDQANDSPTIGQPSQSQSQSQEDIPSLRSGSASVRTRAKPRVPLPDLWQLDERDFEHAAGRGFRPEQIRAMASAFANHHRSRGSLMADWHAAWRTWCDNEIKFNANRPNGGSGNGRRTVQDAARELRDETVAAVLAFDEPAPGGLRDGAGHGVVRMLPPR